MTSEILYPNLGRRIKAVLVDSIIFTILIMTLIPFLAKFEFYNTIIKLLVLFSPFFILEPLMVSLTGGSIGHHVLKIRVRDADRDKNINIFLASLRSVVKLLLGGISLILVLFTKKHQALHDMITNSIVTINDSNPLAEQEGLKERAFREEGYSYPSIIRRFFIILFYNFALFIFVSIISSFFISEPCVDIDDCNTKEEIYLAILGVFWVIGIILIITKGIRARLFGCRRKPVA